MLDTNYLDPTFFFVEGVDDPIWPPPSRPQTRELLSERVPHSRRRLD